jgi:hypothetical protein
MQEMAYAALTCILLKRERNNENNFLEFFLRRSDMILHISQTSYFFIWEKFLKKLDKIGKIVL